MGSFRLVERIVQGTRAVCGGMLCAAAISGGAAQAEVKVSGFTDMGYNADQTKVTGQSDVAKDNYFFTDDVDIFLQSNLGDDFSWLAETTFSQPSGNFTKIDVERVLLNYRPNDAFNIGIGRFHTALGYWNDTFHHGAWLASSINRPWIYTFEDGGGILPIHSVGLEIRGKLGGGKFGYIFNLANGRGPTPNPVQFSGDANESKAVNALLYWNTPLEGLRIGAGYYLDAVPALAAWEANEESNAGTGYAAHNGLKENIVDAHLVYKAHDVEWINEYHSITHKYDPDHVDTVMDNVTTKVTSFFTQIGCQIKDVYTPYVRYESIAGDKDHDDWYSADLSGNPLSKGLKHEIDTVGMRFDANDVVALKFEIGIDKQTNSYDPASGFVQPGPGVTAPAARPDLVTVSSVRGNVSFAF